jgi:hypothetical protein
VPRRALNTVGGHAVEPALRRAVTADELQAAPALLPS